PSQYSILLVLGVPPPIISAISSNLHCSQETQKEQELTCSSVKTNIVLHHSNFITFMTTLFILKLELHDSAR
ncbi:MAG: hypothetical protein JXR69_01830, partial [Candidatus Delongbacteria bacterium]|nr:hypothetical protein [Candidatus Delongbacteria bacterium]